MWHNHPHLPCKPVRSKNAEAIFLHILLHCDLPYELHSPFTCGVGRQHKKIPSLSVQKQVQQYVNSNDSDRHGFFHTKESSPGSIHCSTNPVPGQQSWSNRNGTSFTSAWAFFRHSPRLRFQSESTNVNHDSSSRGSQEQRETPC